MAEATFKNIKVSPQNGAHFFGGVITHGRFFFMPCAKTWLCLALYYLVEESELDSFLGFHPVIAVAKRFDLLDRLTAVLGQYLVQIPLQAFHLFEVDGLIFKCGVADAGTGLVDHKPRVG